MSPATGWRVRDLAREAARNLSARGGRALLSASVVVLASGALSAFSLAETVSFERLRAELAAEGRDVVVVSGASPDRAPRIDRRSCENLGDLAGVERAGVVIPAGRAEVLPLGANVPLFRVSSTLLPALATGDAFVGSALRDGVAGSPVRLTIGRSTLDGVTGSRQPPGVDVNSGVSVAASVEDSHAEACLVVVDPRVDRVAITPALLSSLSATGPPLAARPVLRESTDIREAFLARPTRFAGPAAGVLLGALVGLSVIARSSELAAYRLSGTSRRDFATLLGLEVAFAGGLGATGAALAALALTPFGADPVVGALRALVLGASSAGVALVVSLPVAVRRPTDLAKER